MYQAPQGYPLVGHIPQWTVDRLGFLSKCATSGAPIIDLHLGQRALLLNNHDDIRYVLETHYTNYLKNPRLHNSRGQQLFGKSVQTQYNADHIQQRRQVQPALIRKAIAPYTLHTVNTADAIIESWGNSTLDIAQKILHLMHCVLGKMLFSLDYDQEDRAFGDAVIRRRQQVNHQFNRGAALLEFFTHPNAPSFGQTMRHLEQQTEKMIRARQAAPEQYQDLLSMFVKIQAQSGKMTDAQLCDEALSTTGGYETIAAMVIWTCYLLSTHPQVEAQFLHELRQVLGDRLPTATDLPNLTYTKMVLDESLRLYPPTWIFTRFVQDPDELPSGRRVATGTKLYLCPYAVHRNPRYFINPNQFVPERFSDAGKKTRPRFAYFPFGGGPRVCIGQTLSEMTATLVLVAIAQRVRLTLPPSQKIAPKPNITLLPAHGLVMQIRPLVKNRTL